MMVLMTDANESGGERTTDGGAAHPPLTSEEDRTVVAAQIGREPRAMEGVAARCVFGYPAVTKQAPVDRNGQPFPTAFYLTCPHLVKQIDRIEGAGGVKRYEQALQDEPELHAATMESHARHRALTKYGNNIAASSNPDHPKCLHAHAAFELAMGDHPMGARVLDEAEPDWCANVRCASLLDRG
ncbi:MAG: hypothetical protein JWN72_1448 [Thermoleophilia bacterium]|nr:hypothetical protein [Thermoleophilia bacterium]